MRDEYTVLQNDDTAFLRKTYTFSKDIPYKELDSNLDDREGSGLFFSISTCRISRILMRIPLTEFLLTMSNKTGTTRGEGSAYPSRTFDIIKVTQNFKRGDIINFSLVLFLQADTLYQRCSVKIHKHLQIVYSYRYIIPCLLAWVMLREY